MLLDRTSRLIDGGAARHCADDLDVFNFLFIHRVRIVGQDDEVRQFARCDGFFDGFLLFIALLPFLFLWRMKNRERAWIIGQVNPQANQPSVLDQAALDDAREQSHIDIPAAHQHGYSFPLKR